MPAITTRTLGEKIYDLAGLDPLTNPTSIEEELYAYWRAGARDFVSRAMVNNPQILNGMISQAEADNSATHINVTTESINTVMSVMRNDYPCVQISYADSKLYNDATSGSIYEASTFNPVFFIDPSTANESRVKVLPVTHTTIKVNYISFTAIDAVVLITNAEVNPPRTGATSVSNLPTAVELGISTYVAIRLLDHEINAFMSSGDFSDAMDSAKNFMTNLSDSSVDIDVKARLAEDEIETATVSIGAAKGELERAMGSLKDVEQWQMRKNQLVREYHSFFGGRSPEKEDKD